MYKSKKTEDFGKMNEKGRLEQEKQLKKEVKKIFKKYLISTQPFDVLQDAKTKEQHIEVFQAIQYNTDDEKFNCFINALVEKGLIEYTLYGTAFNFNIGNYFFRYSPLLDSLMELEDYTISSVVTRIYKTDFSDYIYLNRFDLSKHHFEDFKYLSKRVNWPDLIRHSIVNGNFGNDVSADIIKKSIGDIFIKNSACRYFKSGGYEGLLSLISYGLFDDAILLNKIAKNDPSIDVNDDMIIFLRDYCINDYETKEERYRELHSKYALKYLPLITIHGFEDFYWFLRNHVSHETRLLLI